MVLAAVAAGVALGTIAAFTFEPARWASLQFAQAYLAVANAFLLFAVVALSVLYGDARRARLRVAFQTEETMGRVLTHVYSVASARASLSAQGLNASDDADGFQLRAAQTAEFLQLLVNEAQLAFETFTEHRCAASIKLLTRGVGDVPSILSYVRDERSAPSRRDLYGNAGAYPITDHSPFVQIFTRSLGQDYYLENDLGKAEAHGDYQNGNPIWRKLYNATLIVPIGSPSPAPSESVAGFLCVDSLSAKFDSNVCPVLGRTLATSAFLALYELSFIEHQRRSGVIAGSEEGRVSNAG